MPDCVCIPSCLQELPAAGAHFCLGIERFITDTLQLSLKGSGVLVAFSGGADSTALLLCLHYLSSRLGCSVQAAHIDHALRPSSAQEAVAVGTLCAALQIPFHAIRIDVGALALARKQGVEEAGRNARLEYLCTLRSALGLDWVVQGHQLHDLGEDVLMRLLRGSGWPALGGMQAVLPDMRIFRPLLHSTRESIESFVQALPVPYIEDASNTALDYLRNRVRASILPLFLQENPSFLQNIVKLWQGAQDDALWFDSVLSCVPVERLEEPQRLRIACATLYDLPRAVRLRLYKQCLEQLGPGQAVYSVLCALDVAVCAVQGRAIFQFPQGKQAVLTTSHLNFILVEEK